MTQSEIKMHSPNWDLWTTYPADGWVEAPIDVLVGLYVFVESKRLPNGIRSINTKLWHPRFGRQEIVRLAYQQGWENQLKAKIVREVKADLRGGVELREPNEYMPTSLWMSNVARERGIE